MPTYNNGNNPELGLGGNVTLTPANIGVTNATLTLTGVLTTFTIDSQTGATTDVDNTLGVGDNLILNTDGGNIVLNSSALAVHALGAVDVTINGGSFAIGSALINGNVVTSESVTFGASGGTEIVGTPGSFVNLNLLTASSPITLNGPNDVIDDASLSFGGPLSYTITAVGGNDQVVVSNGTNNLTFDITGTKFATGTFNTTTGGPLNLSSDSNGGTNITVCFVRGTRIATPDHEAAVESLQAGDLVMVQSDGQLQARPVKWVGRRRIALFAHPQPETAAPVRIRRDAFADNVPHRDLLVSPDHAIFTDGMLICARQLINGTTILQEQAMASVEYFHIELDQHAILLAEGLPSESYLDTGNRGFFAGAREPSVLHPNLADDSDHLTRATASCAPFVWDEASVRPVWDKLSRRAAAMGRPVPVLETTADPDLCIVVQGRLLPPTTVTGDLYRFVVPKGTTEVRVVSRAALPSDSRPWMEDRRRLGVYVEHIALRGWDNVQDISIDHPGLTEGWWDIENENRALRRWTDGDARLPLPAMAGPTVLEIRASASGIRYLANAGTGRRAA